MDGPDFHQKRKNLFDCLEHAEKSLNSDSTLVQRSKVTLDQLIPRPRDSEENKRRKTVIRNLSRKESIFKRPELPIQKCMPVRRVPDYKINPHKWKKYSLEDTDCSDRTNTAAALNFLREIEQRKDDEMEVKQSSKIVFKKSSKFTQKEKLGTVGESSKLKGSKVMMPEYVVGQKNTVRKEKIVKSDSKSDKLKELKLDHLLEDEDDDGT